MQEITMNSRSCHSFKEVFEEFVISKTALRVSDTTLSNYHYFLKNVAHYIDIDRSIGEIMKRDIEQMAAAMLQKGVKHNTIATNLRRMKAFLNWCKAEDICYVSSFKEKETVTMTTHFFHFLLVLFYQPRDRGNEEIILCVEYVCYTEPVIKRWCNLWMRLRTNIVLS